jgi:ketosteroid isomerase-like protein
MKQFPNIPDVIIDGEVMEAIPPRRLVQTWRMLMEPGLAAEGFTRLTYELEPVKGGVTKLTVTHDVTGAPTLGKLFAGVWESKGAGGGWPEVLSGLRTLLETGAQLPFQSGPEKNQSYPDPASKDETDIRGLLDSVRKAHHDKDAAALIAPYVDGAVIYDLAPPLSHPGMDLETKQTWLDTWDGPIEIEAKDFRFTIRGDAAFGHGFYRMSGIPKAAGRPVSFWMRATVCLHRDKGVWQVVHEHTSVPFYMDGSLRPAFDLEP